MTTLLVLGFLVGVRHALEADHVAAVAALVTRSASFGEMVKCAAAWGVGHAAALVALGSALLVTGVALPEAVTRGLEVGVGAMLVVLGADVVFRGRRKRIHLHVHQHPGGVRHVHVHAHEGEREHDRAHHRHGHPSTLWSRAVVVGAVHGLAGSAALVLVWVDAIGSPAQALSLVLLFALGSIAGMVAFSVVIALPLRGRAQPLGAALHPIESALGVATIALGAWVGGRAAFF